MPSAESNKAKIANRVIEVLDFFDDVHSEATVMDIVRRYNRPQSSTSELLSSLVNLGLLYKDPVSRSYSPTPRAALLGSTTQPDIIRDGRGTHAGAQGGQASRDGRGECGVGRGVHGWDPARGLVRQAFRPRCCHACVIRWAPWRLSRPGLALMPRPVSQPVWPRVWRAHRPRSPAPCGAPARAGRGRRGRGAAR